MDELDELDELVVLTRRGATYSNREVAVRSIKGVVLLYTSRDRQLPPVTCWEKGSSAFFPLSNP